MAAGEGKKPIMGEPSTAVTRRHPLSVTVLLCVALGGALGTASRAGITLAFPEGPWAATTLVINLVGCIVLAGLSSYAVHHPIPDWFRAGFGTGFCGAFTTFSTLMLLFVRLPPWWFAGYLLLSIVVCLLAVVLTQSLVNRLMVSGSAR